MSQAQRSQAQHQLRQRAPAPADAQGKLAQSNQPANAWQQASSGEPQNGKPKAFNLIMEGVGYLNRVRWVQVKKDPSYLCCTVNAMMGVEGEVEFVSIDCRVVGQQAIEVVDLLSEAVEARSKVIVGFRASDPKPDFYSFPDAKTKETINREGFKARLLQITYAKVDGQRIDIPLVERPAASGGQPGSAKPDASAIPQDRPQDPAHRHDDDDGVGSACEDNAHAAA